MSDRIVGIDLGTSNTVAAIVDDLDKVRVLADADGNTVHPSVVSFHPSGGVVVGVKGKQRKVLDPRNTIYSAKRMIGQPFKSFAVTETARRVAFEIKEGPNEQAIVVTRTGEFAIPEISAIVLDHARKIASASLGAEIGRAVVTVPASFTDVQRASTANAGALAGLTVVRVLNEPTAAALAYGSTKRLNEIIAVYDFGGGTFDITILKLEDQVYTVLGTSGDAFLGGEDMDEKIVDKMADSFLKQNRIDLRTDDVSMMRLRAVAEHTKIELSRRSRAVVKIEEVAYAANGTAIDLTMEITREDFLSSIKELVDRTFVSCKEAMALANVGHERIADIILVGGTTRIPYVRDQVSRFFHKAPRFDVNPDDAIATGAALQASSIEQMLSQAPAKRRKEPDDPATTQKRADAFFGDLFGDKAAKPVAPAAPPAPAKPAAPAAPPARALRPSKELDWEPPEGTAFSDDQDAVNIVFGPEATISAALDERIGAEAPRLRQPKESLIPIEVSEPAISLDDIADEPIELMSSSQIELEDVDDSIDEPPPKVEISLPAIELHEIDDLEIAPSPALRPLPTQPKRPPTAQIPVKQPARRELDWEPPPGVELEPPVLDDDFATDEPRRRAPPAATPPPTTTQRGRSLDWDPDPQAPPASPPAREPLPPAPLFTRADSRVEPPPAAPLPAIVPIAIPTRAPTAVVDVTPRGLGIATVAGFCEELIRRNSQLPAAVRKSFATSRDGQDTVRIVVCQGESRRLASNVVIGDLVLSNLPRRARGETRIDVEFVLDASGILNVAARDSATGAEQRAKLDLKGGMAPEELQSAAKRLRQLSSAVVPDADE